MNTARHWAIMGAVAVLVAGCTTNVGSAHRVFEPTPVAAPPSLAREVPSRTARAQSEPPSGDTQITPRAPLQAPGR